MRLGELATSVISGMFGASPVATTYKIVPESLRAFALGIVCSWLTFDWPSVIIMIMF